jgi:putative FmdB family regulatory protein
MPVYEYQCNACQHAFEEWQKIKDPPVRTCPKCAQEAVERLISQTAFQLKGGGWYKDLYSSGKPKADGADKSAKADSKSETKGETKPDKGGGDKGGGGDGGGGTKTESKPESKPADSGKSSGGGTTSGSSGSKTSSAAAG